MAKILTAKAIEAMKPDPVQRLEVPDAAMPGLYLVVQPGGARSWAFRHRVGGKPRKLTIGRYPAIGLAEARAGGTAGGAGGGAREGPGRGEAAGAGRGAAAHGLGAGSGVPQAAPVQAPVRRRCSQGAGDVGRCGVGRPAGERHREKGRRGADRPRARRARTGGGKHGAGAGPQLPRLARRPGRDPGIAGGWRPHAGAPGGAGPGADRRRAPAGLAGVWRALRAVRGLRPPADPDRAAARRGGPYDRRRAGRRPLDRSPATGRRTASRMRCRSRPRRWRCWPR